MEKLPLENFFWMNPPQNFELRNDQLIFTTEPETDFWQKTYYGFQHDNAPAFLTRKTGDFSLQVKVEFAGARHMYDQSGMLVYQNQDYWMKASVECENDAVSRLGSVVTNGGYSDWASRDIDAAVSEIWYRLSHRGQDFLVESSFDGKEFQQMRIFHLGGSCSQVNVGVYACSPLNSSFTVVFSGFKAGSCLWKSPHEQE